MGNPQDIITFDMYADTTPWFTDEECELDNIVAVEAPRWFLELYYNAYVKHTGEFVSFDKWYEEEYTCDDFESTALQSLADMEDVWLLPVNKTLEYRGHTFTWDDAHKWWVLTGPCYAGEAYIACNAVYKVKERIDRMIDGMEDDE